MKHSSRCCIVYCRRKSSKYGPDEEWICGEHWRLTPKRMRAVWRRVHRRATEAEARGNDADFYPAAVAAWRVWKRIKREATEVAVGIRVRRA